MRPQEGYGSGSGFPHRFLLAFLPVRGTDLAGHRGNWGAFGPLLSSGVILFWLRDS